MMTMMSQVVEVHNERGTARVIATGAGSGSSGGLCASSALAGSAGGASGPTAASSAGGASKMGSFLTGQVIEKCEVLKMAAVSNGMDVKVGCWLSWRVSRGVLGGSPPR